MVYEYDCYRKYLKEFVQGQRSFGFRVSYARLAEAMRVQRSYLSQILAGKGNLTSDQLYLAAKAMNLGEDERRYLLLLLEVEKSQVPERRADLLEQRDTLRRAKLKSEVFLNRQSVSMPNENLAVYYSDPFCSLVHLALTIPSYQKDPMAICGRLGISKDRFKRTLEILERCHLVEIGKNSIVARVSEMHLERASYFSEVHAAMFRMKAIDVRQRGADADDYFFTTSFCADNDTRVKIKSAFMQFLQATSSKIAVAPSQEIFHLNFDLFRI